MRGQDIQQADWLSYKTLEERVPEDHPLRLFRLLTNGSLLSMDGQFEKLYSRTGRPSIPPVSKEFTLIARLSRVI